MCADRYSIAIRNPGLFPFIPGRWQAPLLRDALYHGIRHALHKATAANMRDLPGRLIPLGSRLSLGGQQHADFCNHLVATQRELDALPLSTALDSLIQATKDQPIQCALPLGDIVEHALVSGLVLQQCSISLESVPTSTDLSLRILSGDRRPDAFTLGDAAVVRLLPDLKRLGYEPLCALSVIEHRWLSPTGFPRQHLPRADFRHFKADRSTNEVAFAAAQSCGLIDSRCQAREIRGLERERFLTESDADARLLVTSPCWQIYACKGIGELVPLGDTVLDSDVFLFARDDWHLKHFFARAMLAMYQWLRDCPVELYNIVCNAQWTATMIEQVDQGRISERAAG